LGNEDWSGWYIDQLELFNTLGCEGSSDNDKGRYTVRQTFRWTEGLTKIKTYSWTGVQSKNIQTDRSTFRHEFRPTEGHINIQINTGTDIQSNIHPDG